MTPRLSGKIEEAACPMCGSVDRKAMFRFGDFGVVRCASCGLEYLSPRLVEEAMLDLYRSGEYYEGGLVGYDSYAGQEAALRATFRRVVEGLVHSGFGGGDLLEVGCGYGYFLEAARPAFRTVLGTEFSQTAAAAARARGLEVITGGLADLPAGAQFDCVFSGHVVEHIYDPRAFVAGLSALTRPGGAIVLGAPDSGSFLAHAMGSRWPSFKIPEHVVYFDRVTLSRLMADAGLEDVRPFHYPHAFPLALVFKRLGLGWLGDRSGRVAGAPVWLPATTVAVSGRQPEVARAS
jgi:SAM-dependent methyltransferase/Zn ribbon nucleic-acid-binding protein